MKKGTTKKEVTMEGIAKLVATSQKVTMERLEKHIAHSYESLARSVAEGFAGVDKRFESLETDIESFKRETEDNFVKTRTDILNLDQRFVPRHEFESRIKSVSDRISKIHDHGRR